MKIGILTFHNSDNYGSVLQNYALQQYLMVHYNISVEDINFLPPNSELVNGYFEKVTSARKLIKNFVKISGYQQFKKRQSDFANFRRKYLRISKKVYSENNANDIANDYSLVICGSDQIWNTACQDFSWAYYLRNIPVKRKISYGCSMGACDFSENDWSVIKPSLSEFDCISVREQNAVVKILSNTGIVCSCVPDPTFLISKQNYEKAANDRIITGDFIFIYMINMDPDAMKLASDIVSMLDKPAYTIISCKDSFKWKSYKNIKFVEDNSPEAFLSYIRDACIVLTNSFHGTAFSLIFHKNFYTIGALKNDSRISTILSELNLTDRAVESVKSVRLDDDIDYESRNDLINKVTTTGKIFLDKGLHDEYCV